MTDASFDSRQFLRNVSRGPGVYRMLDADGAILYVGKASSLRKRLASYFRASESNPKTRVMLSQLADIQVTVTHTETEALLLENNLIKEHRPRYNVVLRDDKTYPYIRLLDTHPFPRLSLYRGSRKEVGRYFGPYPSAYSARETVNLLQKLFQLRQCNDAFFRNRSRPCLQYQIKRCSAPCVNYITPDAYAQDVSHAVMFLEGRTGEVVSAMVRRMEQASERTEYELAARYRDQIASLRKTAEHQSVSSSDGEYDVIGAAIRAGGACITVMFVRGGRHLGNQNFYPRVPDGCGTAELLGAFLPQYYLGREVPPLVVVPETVDDSHMIEQTLGEKSGHAVRLRHAVRGERKRLARMAVVNATQALNMRLAMDASLRSRFESLQDALKLERLPERLECFDISHTMGEGTVASCVVFDTGGPRKTDYRRFNIEGLAAGDDYAAMAQVLERRYTRLKKGEGVVPDVLFVDGGKGQVSTAAKILEELQVEGVTLVGVAKGPSRKPGLEQLFLAGAKSAIRLPADSPALQLIQQIRDEAHRFAITGHRQRRAKSRRTSVLEDIPGLGPKRRQTLLRQFGGLRGLSRAGVEDIASAPGISLTLAQRIYDMFHAGN